MYLCFPSVQNGQGDMSFQAKDSKNSILSSIGGIIFIIEDFRNTFSTAVYDNYYTGFIFQTKCVCRSATGM